MGLRQKSQLLGNDKVTVLINEQAPGNIIYSSGERAEDSAEESGSLCQVRGALPDPECTPGAVFPDATKEIICQSGYTKKVRKVSTKLRKEIYKNYGISYPQPRGFYELDHLIPLAIGGSNDKENLFPESAFPKPGFKEKDLVEIYLREKVCQGLIPLQVAQKQVAADWLVIYGELSPEQILELKSRYRNWSN